MQARCSCKCGPAPLSACCQTHDFAAVQCQHHEQVSNICASAWLAQLQTVSVDHRLQLPMCCLPVKHAVRVSIHSRHNATCLLHHENTSSAVPRLQAVFPEPIRNACALQSLVGLVRVQVDSFSPQGRLLHGHSRICFLQYVSKLCMHTICLMIDD